MFLVFALLQGVALSFYFTYLTFPRSQFLTTASVVNGNLLEARNAVSKHFRLEGDNKKLQHANTNLRKKIPQSFTQIDKHAYRINDSLYRQQYEYIPGTVINSTFDKRNNYFTLNIGAAQGVKRGQGVISDKGVVGVIHNTSDHFSVVKSCLTENINVDIMVEKTGQFGLLKWNGKDPRKGTMWGVSNDLHVKKWSNIVTRGGSGMFPIGIPVGKISKAAPVEGKPLWDLTILFAEDYRSIRSVYVVRNLLLDEQKRLENQIPVDKE